ncbi:MAG: mannose-1-phosphate guanylyltransferase [Planctomycetaceae bacterium]|nr:mannose-1-phosphate guanylyltransferase [Planctomycetaceae bacterium]
MLHAVIMAGGSGTRFWPQSRQNLPKQLLKLAGDRTMIQQTMDRCSGMIESGQFWVVTNSVQADQTRQQLPEIPPSNVLVEPAARNTAPCIGLAAVHLLHDDPDAIMFVMPADHVISPVAVFQQAAETAVRVVEQDPQRLVLFGVTPTFPATGYGYIERGAELAEVSGAFAVQSFREKPALNLATQYMDSGAFYWNCGIFCWKASTILDQLQANEPDTHGRLMQVAAVIGTDAYESVLNEQFPQMNSISIDFAVLERATTATVIEAPFTWDDVGSWLAVPRLAGTDDHGNTIDGTVVALETQGCIVRNTGSQLVATLGVEDLIIVSTDDVIMIARRDDSERVKEILEELRRRGMTQYL